MIEHLPPESSTWTAIRNDAPDDDSGQESAQRPEEGRWSQVEMLLASVLEAIRDLHHHDICLNWDKKHGPRPKSPPRIRRPGWRPPETTTAPSPAWAVAHLDAMLDGLV